MQYQHLLFDLDHTLLDFTAGEEIALTQFLESMDVADIDGFKSIYRPINQGMWKDLEKGLISKKELINTRFSRAFAHFGRTVLTQTSFVSFPTANYLLDCWNNQPLR